MLLSNLSIQQAKSEFGKQPEGQSSSKARLTTCESRLLWVRPMLKGQRRFWSSMPEKTTTFGFIFLRSRKSEGLSRTIRRTRSSAPTFPMAMWLVIGLATGIIKSSKVNQSMVETVLYLSPHLRHRRSRIIRAIQSVYFGLIRRTSCRSKVRSTILEITFWRSLRPKESRLSMPRTINGSRCT